VTQPAMVRKPELEVLCRIAEAAAQEVMAVYAGDIAAWNKPDLSPLTSADLRSDAVIRRELSQAFPGVFILSEESGAEVPGDRDTFFLVDPLDGTREFIQRNGEFTVNIALVQRGEPVAGVVLAPALGELFFGASGIGAWKKEGGGVTPVHVARRAPDEPLRVIGSRSHGGKALVQWLARLPCPYRFEATGSSLKFCRVAQGLADIYPRIGPTCQWDTAAGHAVLQAAGGAVLDSGRQPLAYGLLRPALNPNFIALADTSFQFPPLN
jgi:3'(2'), 5'-bisphosphate nucleotidase